MSRNAANHRGVAGASRAQIVAALSENPGLSRKELAEYLSVGRATVTEQVRKLMEHGIVRELPPRVEGAGRPRVPLELVAEAGHSVGVSVEPDHLVLLAARADGEILATGKLPFDARAPEPAGRIASLISAWTAELVGPVVKPAIGVALSGVVDEGDGTVKVSVVLGWDRFPLGSQLRAELGPNLWVANDMRALAARPGPIATDELGPDYLFIALRSGVGMVIVRDRRVLVGVDGASNEFSHVSIDPAGPLCGCGNHGCVEQYVGERELADKVELQTGHRAASWRELAGLARAHPSVAAVLREAGWALGRATGGAATLTGIPGILITGEGLAAWSAMAEGFSAGIAGSTPTLLSRPTTSLQPWDDFSIARGVAALALTRSITRPVGR